MNTMDPGDGISVEELKGTSASLNLVTDAPKKELNSGVDVPKEVLLDAFVHEPATDLELKSSDISAAVFGSGHALGGHMSNPQQEILILILSSLDQQIFDIVLAYSCLEIIVQYKYSDENLNNLALETPKVITQK
ncbi:hypothetical protein ACJX0J_016642, partial [Zea mays]